MSDTHYITDAERALSLGEPRATPLVMAQARLAASRARLRRQFIRPPAPPRHERAPTGSSAQAWLQGLLSGPWRFLRERLQGNVLASAALDGIGRWWSDHPLRDTAELAGSEIAGEWRRKALPLLRRHPIASVAIASLAGAALVTAKPWRSTHVRARLRPLPRRVGSWLMAQFPLRTVLTGLVVLMAGRAGTEDAAPAQSRSAPPGHGRI